MQEDIHAPREYVFFMGGAARYDQVWYSHGMRQNLFMMFENKTGVAKPLHNG
jgi:hypothetical protein